MNFNLLVSPLDGYVVAGGPHKKKREREHLSPSWLLSASSLYVFTVLWTFSEKQNKSKTLFTHHTFHIFTTNTNSEKKKTHFLLQFSIN